MGACGVKCAKAVLITFNLLFWLSGCGLIALGIYFLIEQDRSNMMLLFAMDEQVSPQQYLSCAIIGIGAVVFIIGFFGCCGTMQESKCMLVTYFFFLFLILCAELAVGVLAMHFEDKMVPELEGKVRETLKWKYGVEDSVTQAIDFAQAKFECCGVRDGGDFADSVWRQRLADDFRTVSPTCCVLKNPSDMDVHLRPQPLNDTLCHTSPSDFRFRHQKGCKEKLVEFFKNSSMCLVLVGFAASALEIFGMVFSICLCKAI